MHKTRPVFFAFSGFVILALLAVYFFSLAFSHLDPEFIRALRMDLKSHEIDVAVKHFKAKGQDTQTISGKQLNDFVEEYRKEVK